MNTQHSLYILLLFLLSVPLAIETTSSGDTKTAKEIGFTNCLISAFRGAEPILGVSSESAFMALYTCASHYHQNLEKDFPHPQHQTNVDDKKLFDPQMSCFKNSVFFLTAGYGVTAATVGILWSITPAPVVNVPTPAA